MPFFLAEKTFIDNYNDIIVINLKELKLNKINNIIKNIESTWEIWHLLVSACMMQPWTHWFVLSFSVLIRVFWHVNDVSKLFFKLYYRESQTLKSDYSKNIQPRKKNGYEISWPRVIKCTPTKNLLKTVLENWKKRTLNTFVLLVKVQAWRIRAFDIPDAHQYH